jgi:benzoate-CoA ligase family protein
MNSTVPVTFPEGMNLADYYLFDRLADGLGAKVAIRFGECAYTYDDVAERARRFANAIRDVGARRGERVLIVLPDVPPFAWVLFGTLLRGCVVAMGNPHAPAEQIAYLIEYTRAAVVVTTPEVAASVRGAIESGSVGRELLAVFLAPDAPTGDDPERPLSQGAIAAAWAVRAKGASPVTQQLVDALALAAPIFEPLGLHRDEPAMWLFTSGSTGEPKANIHSHRDFAFNTEVYAKRTVGYRASDLTVSVPRLFFGYATGTNLMFPFAVGATTALFSERPTPEVLARVIESQRPTVVTNVPTMLGKLLEYDAERTAKGERPLDLSSLRFSLSAGEALPEALLARWMERFGSDVYDGIGSAEMFHIYASNRPGDIKPGSLGKVVSGYELSILPEDAKGLGAKPCEPGEIGVLWVKGDSVSHGYWLDRDKSFATFFGHACRSGDLFRVDQDGYLYFAGRADELLKVGGQWVAPVEVEDCLMRHPAVAAAAVIGIEDDGLTKPKAFVVLRGSNTTSYEALSKELQEFVRERLSKHKYPRSIDFVDDLPKNDRGKIDRKELRRRHGQGRPM